MKKFFGFIIVVTIGILVFFVFKDVVGVNGVMYKKVSHYGISFEIPRKFKSAKLSLPEVNANGYGSKDGEYAMRIVFTEDAYIGLEDYLGYMEELLTYGSVRLNDTTIRMNSIIGKGIVLSSEVISVNGIEVAKIASTHDMFYNGKQQHVMVEKYAWNIDDGLIEIDFLVSAEYMDKYQKTTDYIVSTFKD